GHAQVIDSMIHDGLWDAYGNVHMGDCAELCAKEKGITRADQDAFAVESYKRALRAQAEGTVTAGNASSINDGAAALVLAAADVARARGWKPVARIVGAAGHAQAPEWF